MIIKNSQLQAPTTVSLMAYGAAKVRKTRLALTMPQPFILNHERDGTLSLRDKPIAYDDFFSFDAAWKFITNKSQLQQLYDKGFRTLVDDSLSDLADLQLNIERQLVKDARMAYRNLFDKLRDYIAVFFSLEQFHRVIIFHESPPQDSDETHAGKLGGPSIPGQAMGYELPYKPSELFRVFVKADRKTYLQCKADHRYQAGDRSGMLAAEEGPAPGADAPDMTTIFNKIVATSPQKAAT